MKKPIENTMKSNAKKTTPSMQDQAIKKDTKHTPSVSQKPVNSKKNQKS